MKFPVLSRSPLFRGLTDEETDLLLERINHSVKSFPEGTIAAMEGEEITSLMLVLSGNMRGEMMDVSGRIIKIEDIYPPQALAAAFMYGATSHYPVNVIANVDSKLLIIRKDDFLKLLHDDSRVLANYLNVICTKALFLSDRLKFLSFNTIKGKLAYYLMKLPGASSGKVTIDRSQQELSEYFGVTRPSLARALGDMEKEGLLSVSRRNVSFRDMEGLIRAAQK